MLFGVAHKVTFCAEMLTLLNETFRGNSSAFFHRLGGRKRRCWGYLKKYEPSEI
jgi:hypothetical protein